MEAAHVFGKMGYYWAEISDQSYTDRQIKFLQNYLRPEGSILDLACGTGRHSIALTKQGFYMIGLDLSTSLLRISRQRSKAVHLISGDIRFLPFKTQTFTAAVSMDTSFGYLSSQKDDLQSLAEVRRVLNLNSMLILDVFNQPNIASKYQVKANSSKWREYPSFFLLQQRSVSSNGGWLYDTWTIRSKISGEVSVFQHTVRLYKAEELKELLIRAGFVVREIIGDYEGQQYSTQSPRLIFLAITN